MVDHTSGVVQRQCSACPGGSDFTHAVANDGHRYYAFYGQHAGDTHLQCKQRRLRKFSQLIAVIAQLDRQFGDQRITG
ncbi:hypothetical protein D3C87_1154720 [compost metagenome]